MPNEAGAEVSRILVGNGRAPALDPTKLANLVVAVDKRAILVHGATSEAKIGGIIRSILNSNDAALAPLADDHLSFLLKFKKNALEGETPEKVMLSQELAQGIYRALIYPDKYSHVKKGVLNLKQIARTLEKTEYAKPLGEQMYIALVGAQTHAALAYALREQGYMIILPDLDNPAECKLMDYSTGTDFAAFENGQLYLIDSRIELRDTAGDYRALKEAASVTGVWRHKYKPDDVAQVKRLLTGYLKDFWKGPIGVSHVVITVPSFSMDRNELGKIEPLAVGDIIDQMSSFQGK